LSSATAAGDGPCGTETGQAGRWVGGDDDGDYDDSDAAAAAEGLAAAAASSRGIPREAPVAYNWSNCCTRS
jgi:hypothetical protein